MDTVVLFGAGKVGQNFVEKMIHDSCCGKNNTVIFCDNNVVKANTVICNVPVICFNEMIDIYQKNEIDKIIITTASIHEILYQCNEAKINIDILYVYNMELCTVTPINEYYRYSVYSQDGEEMYLKARFSRQETGTYIDVGANHPFRFSNTYWAYQKGWRGINIEPDIINYKLLCNARKDDINVNCGISDVETECDYYIFKENALNTFVKDEIRRTDELQSVCKISMRRLDNIMNQYNMYNIDFIDIDVEGMELNVLSSIDWNKASIDCILVEQRNMTLESVLKSDVFRFLKDKGYTPVSKYNRTVIYEKIQNL